MAAKSFNEPKFVIYRAENGWALFIPKDESVVAEYGSMVTKMMGQFGMGGDPILEQAKAKQQNPSSKIHGLFLFEKWDDLIGFIKLEFENEIESKK